MDLTAFLDEFRAEAAEHLRALDAQLLKLERDPSDPAPIREMFLSAHTIKGGAAMMGLEDARVVAHAMEDVLAYLRDQRQPLDDETADLLFRTLDVLRELVERSSPGDAVPDAAISELAASLRQRASGGATAEAPPIAQQAASPGAPRALLVEDSPTVRLLAKRQLARVGFEVDAVADGGEALALALANPYQLVVTGIETRGLRGLDLAAALRAEPSYRHVPIILMSSGENEAHRRRAAEVGVQAYLRKGSFGQRLLAETAARLLALREA
ncbi:MAG: response regulator [Chloroflexi bacterium]|nr:response regulator [Chloroflexota bacterium]